VHAHALWSRMKFKTTKIFSCMFSFIYTKTCTNETFPLYGMLEGIPNTLNPLSWGKKCSPPSFFLPFYTWNLPKV